MGVERGIEEEVKEMGDDDEWGEAVQEAEEPRGTDASMREVQGLIDGDVHMVHGEMEEHYGMDVDGPAPGEDFDEDEDKEEEIHRPVVNSTPNGSLSSGKKHPLRHHHQNFPPQPLNPLHGRVWPNSSLLLFLRKRRRRVRPRRRTWTRSVLRCRL